MKLTDEEIKEIIPDGDDWKHEVGFTEATKFARAIEAAVNAKWEEENKRLVESLKWGVEYIEAMPNHSHSEAKKWASIARAALKGDV